MTEPQPNLGQNDAGLVDTVSDTIENVADAISQKLHPMIGRYVKVVKESARTPVLGRPSDSVSTALSQIQEINRPMRSAC